MSTSRIGGALGQGRRQFMAGVGGALLNCGGGGAPVRDLAFSQDGYVLPECVPLIAGAGAIIPVWLHEGRVTVNRLSRRSSDIENEPGIAVLSYRSGRGSDGELLAAWETRTDQVYQHHSVLRRQPREMMRVVEARTGRVVFTSALSDSILSSSRREVERQPLASHARTGFTCADEGLSRLFSQSDVAPYHEYFAGRPLPVPLASAFRNHLRRHWEDDALIKVLSPDFSEWFWRRVSRLPELPDPEAILGAEGAYWKVLAEAYI